MSLEDMQTRLESLENVVTLLHKENDGLRAEVARLTDLLETVDMKLKLKRLELLERVMQIE